MTESHFPPHYIKLPPAVACADEDDAVKVTMALILGLCWANRYRQTLPYTPDQLADLLKRSRATLYRHLNRLQQIGWLKVHRAEGRRLVLQPLICIVDQQPAMPETPGPTGYTFPKEERMNDQRELCVALQEAGIIGRAYRELLQKEIDPLTVRAWYWWTWAPEQEWMDNAAGYVINRLRDGDEPPGEFLELAQLRPEEVIQLKEAWAQSEHTRGWPSLKANKKLYQLAPLWVAIYDAMRGH